MAPCTKLVRSPVNVSVLTANVSSSTIQIPSDVVVQSQATDSIDLILRLIRHPTGVHRPGRNRKSRGAVLSTSEGQWATTQSFMQTCVCTPTHETGILMADILPYAGRHDTRLGRESSWPKVPSRTHLFSGR